MKFKKISFDVFNGRNCVSNYTGEDVTLEEIKRLLENPNVIKLTAVKMTTKEAFNSVKVKA